MKAQNTAAYLIIIAFAIALLVIGKPFLVPLFLAVVIWYLINSINELLWKLPFVKEHIPNWASLFVSD